MLELKSITKDYKVADQTTTVLKGISLAFRNHEFVSILGQSGCGKTTMLNIIGGLDKFTTGDLIINGKSTKKYKDRDWDTYRNHSIGFVFQSYNLIPHQSVLSNVELALSIRGLPKKERRKKALEALEKVGLKDHVRKRPNQLSGGQCQRVSIARALVGNPDIVLADEPTGALDTETSVQIMEILKEISKERLVIMVTHNPELANKYSTRIVRMLDGIITSDSMPVDGDELKVLALEDKEKINTNHNIDVQKNQKFSGRITRVSSGDTPYVFGKNYRKEKNKANKEYKNKKSAMSVFTSIALSASNLLTKKSRTFITALACSIGIIGIAVVLSVSTGMHEYVDVLERESAAANYIMINNTKFQIPTTEDIEGVKVELEEYPSDLDHVFPYKEMTMTDIIKPTKQELSKDYIDYIEKNTNGNTPETSLVIGIDYTRLTNLNIISTNGTNYVKAATQGWTEILDNPEYISTQYTLLASLNGKTIPTEYNEIVLVVDKYNRVSTSVLDALGVNYTEELTQIKYEDLLGKEIRLILNNDFYTKSTNPITNKDKYTAISDEAEFAIAYEKGIPLKVVSIIRENQDASNTWISTGIGYTTALTDYVIEQNMSSDVVKYQLLEENENYDVLKGSPFISMGLFGTSLEDNLKSLGAISTPESIMFYPKDFEAKDKIVEVLDYWNNTEIYKLYGNEKDEEGEYLADAKKVEYIDVSELLASMLGDLIDIITYALVAFSAISLVVSSIMIAIITYASVIERIKEIGTLRSLGARKRDISTVFIAEAGIIGVVSSIIALAATVVINIIINIVLGHLVGVDTIAKLSVSIAFWMIILCVGINLVASLIPARMAAKKDPVVALRTE